MQPDRQADRQTDVTKLTRLERNVSVTGAKFMKFSPMGFVCNHEKPVYLLRQTVFIITGLAKAF